MMNTKNNFGRAKLQNFEDFSKEKSDARQNSLTVLARRNDECENIERG